ncbi:protein jim lovell isoform X2 [Ochlerotatus camptorhynchus]|uniref:protein jim lovell isoform X2 n=1 Tax=Ochlerotatus camptorhynchus TaxID=644619 RepID=UPI0031D2D269
MGSEHYCLRWHNHQSNLLGVFSQLLQDESLVDVTLACSEGASIRAHKVVLSACSSYFQTLFLDHPTQHPIVILKDVPFAELRTLVDFMYKGEVNVEYCQLSALLKTAESLKVKGLAEMTNQNTALAEPKREPERLRPQSHSSAAAATATSLTSASSPVSSAPTAATNTGGNSAAAVSPHNHHHQLHPHHPALGSPTSNAAAVAAAAASLGITDLSTIGKSRGLDPDGRSPSPSRLDRSSSPPRTPLALYTPLRKNRDHTHSGSVSSSATTTITTAAAERSSEERELSDHHHLHQQQQHLRPRSNSGNAFSSSFNSTSEGLSNNNNNNNNAGSGNDDDDDEDNEENGSMLAHEPGTTNSEQDQMMQHCHQRSSVDDDGRRSSSMATNINNNNNNNSDDEYEPPIKIKSEVGLNMTINSPACLANSTTSGLVVNSSIGELRPSSRDSGRGGGTPVACSSTTTALNSAAGGGAMMGGNGSALGGGLDRSSPRSQRDRSERSTFGSGGIPSPLSEPIAGPSGMGPVQQVPLSLKKEIDWDRGDDKSSGDSSLDFRHPHDSNHLNHFFSVAGGNYSRATGIKSAPASAAAAAAAAAATPATSIIGFPGAAVGAIPFVFPFAPLGLGLFDTDPKRILNLLHHQSALAEEALRYRNLLLGTHGPDREPLNLQAAMAAAAAAAASATSSKTSIHSSKQDDEQPSTSRRSESSSSASTASTTITSPPPKSDMIRVRDGLTKDGFHNGIELLLRKPSTIALDEGACSPADLSLYSSLMKASSSPVAEPVGNPGGVQDTKCHICMANFPSVWLLEQHSALQHPHLTIHDDKPYLCGLCGQKSRYTCCRYRTVLSKHREQGSRSRVPGDKLFTCDVCGMQFRYLKSFKKHRLNHALERLHGKKDKGGESEQVSSTNESDSVDLRGLIRDDENMSDNDEQDDTVDSMNVATGTDGPREFVVDEGQGKISSSMMERAVSEFEFKKYQSAHRMEAESSSSSNSIPSTSSSLNQTLNSLINAESIPHHHLLGLNPQEQSILNFLRVDAAEKNRDRRFACPFCGKCVRSKENLKLHVRKHTGERPFVCLFCGRAFGGKSDLTRHLRIHTGERPYHCEACGKCFARADYLSKHLTTHVHNTSPR